MMYRSMPYRFEFGRRRSSTGRSRKAAAFSASLITSGPESFEIASAGKFGEEGAGSSPGTLSVHDVIAWAPGDRVYKRLGYNQLGQDDDIVTPGRPTLDFWAIAYFWFKIKKDIARALHAMHGNTSVKDAGHFAKGHDPPRPAGSTTKRRVEFSAESDIAQASGGEVSGSSSAVGDQQNLSAPRAVRPRGENTEREVGCESSGMQMDDVAQDSIDTDTWASDPMENHQSPTTIPNESGLSGEVVSDVSDPTASDHVPVAAPVVLTESDRTPAHINPRAAVAGRESRAREPVPYTWFQPKRDEAREKHAQHGNPAGRWPRRTRAAMAKRNEAAQAQEGSSAPSETTDGITALLQQIPALVATWPKDKQVEMHKHVGAMFCIVAKQQARLGDDGPRDGYPHPHAAGQLVGKAAAEFGQPHHLQSRGHRGVALFTLATLQLERQRDIPLHGAPWQQRRVLKYERHIASGAPGYVG